jgi:hypothetical protein
VRRRPPGRLRALAFAALVAIATGCSGSDDEKAARTTASGKTETTVGTTENGRAETIAGGWASDRELAWLEKFGRWNTRLNAGIARLQRFATNPRTEGRVERGDAAALAELDRLLEPLRACADKFRTDVGEPPTDRLREAAKLMTDACERYGAAAAALLEGAEEMDEDELADAAAQTDEATDLIARVNEILPPGEAQAVPKSAKAGRSRIDPLYSRVATSVAKAEVEVRCWSRRDWPRLLREERAYADRDFPVDILGLTGYGSRRVNLSPVVCRELDRFAYENWRPRNEAMLLLAYSVVTLAHEVQHRRGVLDEATADCYGMQRAAEVARGLGAGAAYGRELARAYWEDYENLDDAYQSRQCRPGGRLDLAKADPRWP